jgi:hypothetical protein
MAKDNVIQFPNMQKYSKVEKARILQARLDEIENENVYMEKDIEYLQSALKKNLDEAENILKEFAIINGENFFSAGETPVMDFVNEWGDDFEFTPDFDISDSPKTELDELGDKMVDMAKKLEDAVYQLTLDLDINKDKPEDK